MEKMKKEYVVINSSLHSFIFNGLVFEACRESKHLICVKGEVLLKQLCLNRAYNEIERFLEATDFDLNIEWAFIKDIEVKEV